MNNTTPRTAEEAATLFAEKPCHNCGAWFQPFAADDNFCTCSCADQWHGWDN